MYCDLWLQYIKVRKLFKGGNYSRAETIRGNTVFYFSFFFGSDLSKMDQAWSNLIKLHFLNNLKMLLWKVVTFTERIKIAVLFLIFLDQICPKWIKLDQDWISHRSKNVTIKSCHIYKKDKNGCFVFDFFDQICPKWIKLDQTWSNWISHQAKPLHVSMDD